jgi:hypothetical protein
MVFGYIWCIGVARGVVDSSLARCRYADSVDMIRAFSVFTHIEHEDSYLYLKEALRVVRPGGRFVFSCGPVSTTLGKETFLASAGRFLQARYRTVRHIATSRDDGRYRSASRVDAYQAA